MFYSGDAADPCTAIPTNAETIGAKGHLWGQGAASPGFLETKAHPPTPLGDGEVIHRDSSHLVGTGIRTGAFQSLFHGILITDHEVAATLVPILQIGSSRLKRRAQ